MVNLQFSIFAKSGCSRPELNPIERIWSHIKQELSWEIYENLEGIKEKVCAFLGELSTEKIASIAGWDYILSALATIAELWRIGILFYPQYSVYYC